jgi:hypothetical protein
MHTSCIVDPTQLAELAAAASVEEWLHDAPLQERAR